MSHDRLKRENKQLQTEIKQLHSQVGQLETDVTVREKRITGLQNERDRLTQLRVIVQDLQQGAVRRTQKASGVAADRRAA